MALVGLGCAAEPDELGVARLPVIECNSTTVGMPCDTDDTLCTEEVCAVVGADVECVRQATAVDGTLCETDGDPCSADLCSAGVCVHDQLPEGTGCNDSDVCTLGTVCNAAGDCVGGVPVDCSDGNACTDDICHPVAGCSNPPFDETRVCNDGMFCTVGDHCDGAGSCTGSLNCIDGNRCTDDFCDEAADECVNTVVVDRACDDANACTDGDACDSVGTCIGTPTSDGKPCTGAGGCEISGTCTGGVCGGTTPADDGTACDDDDACTTTDECASGVCGGSTVKCKDGDACTIDGCDPGLGCVFPEIAECGPSDAGPTPDGGAGTGDAGSGDGGVAPDGGPAGGDGGFYGELGGGGGCGCRSAGAGSGAGSAGLLLATLWLIGRRRRAGAYVVLGLIVTAASAGGARAEGFDVGIFKPATSSSGFFSQDGAGVVDSGVFNFGVTLDLSSELLVVRAPGGDDVLMDGEVVSDRLALHLTGAYGFGERFEVGARLPVTVAQGGDVDRVRPGQSLATSALGDLELAFKASLVRAGRLRVAAATTLGLPTGSSDDFSGGETVYVEPQLIAAADFGAVAVAVNAGYRLRGESRVGDLTVDDEMLAGVAAAVAVLPDRLWLLGEGFAAFGVQGSGGEGETPAELLGGARYAVSGPWMLQGGVGFGLTRGYGAPALRGVVSLAYAPRRQPAAVTPQPVLVAEPEPEPEPEPVPPPVKDSDGDGLLDPNDPCPDEPEDLDEFQDDDGCPDSDNDADGILDVDDQCPLEAEVVNGVDDEDGCPDEGLIAVKEDKIVLEERVLFDTDRARVKRRGRKLLQAIVSLWRQHPEWKRMVIEGHTDERGPDDYNVWLSEKRAANVRKALIELGVAADKLEAKGLGKSRPLVEGRSDEALRRNRRVEFIIIKVDAAND